MLYGKEEPPITFMNGNTLKEGLIFLCFKDLVSECHTIKGDTTSG
jgi:hypothetical protein